MTATTFFPPPTVATDAAPPPEPYSELQRLDPDAGQLGGSANKPTTTVNIIERAIALNLQMGSLGATKKLSASQIEVDADKSRVSASKSILASPEFEAIRKRQSDMARTIRKLCLPSLFRSGIYLVPIASLAQIDELLLEAQSDIETALVPAFLAVYPKLVEADKIALRTTFNPLDYPPISKVREAFGFEWSYVSFGVPPTLSGIDSDLLVREQKKAADKMQEAAAQIQDILRAQMLDLVSHLADKLGGREDGKKKTFQASTVTNVREFIEMFSAKNITNDEALDRLCAQAKALLSGVDPDTLREQDVVRDRVRAGFEQIKTQLDSMIVARPTRLIQFAEQEEAEPEKGGAQ